MSDNPSLIGDNSGAISRALLADARLAAEPFAARRDEFKAAMAKFVEIRDRIDVGDAGDLIALASRVFALVDGRRKHLVAPHVEAVDTVNAFFRKFWQPVADQIEELRRQIDVFAENERKRIRAQEDEQRRFEEAARGKTATPVVTDEPDSYARRRAAPAPRRQNVRGDYGSNVVFGEADVIEIVDWRQLPDFIMNAEAVREAIVKVARPMVKQKIEISGLKVTKAAATSVRR